MYVDYFSLKIKAELLALLLNYYPTVPLYKRNIIGMNLCNFRRHAGLKFPDIYVILKIQEVSV